MTEHTQSLLREALSLPEAERADLVAELVVSSRGLLRVTTLLLGRRGRRNSKGAHEGSWRASRGARRGPTCMTVFAAR